jgi:small subunit ribosomal protein S17
MSYLGKRKVREGLVVSDKMDKTVVVAVETRKVHPLYKKAVRVTKRYKAHDENNACKIGDKVKIVETRPLSKEKSWRVTEIMSKREVVETGPKKPKKKK